ncbi:flagellar biosynthesis anti-sigma factor FlgM [Nitrosospira multiformis]|uniref:Negative regulator of flagellin synthesis n=1 Tax=Nitrosospira multiformis (strain ATCC 25196 / NCIMB 11849 / C 71) TaxID=323848 RepID=A0A1H5XWK5_NITMU|nr:flagellar biosynthesis anti-sigma factor FlgM [Nitrosospira multiformis]SDZ83134.1 anti-sigma-28 factor, FlgM family [Nitrosospira multiformis]SEG16032.1 anti-sigma-28 factor, FlgM family [Nitrosospira multiformis ATCC 25196]
MKIENSIKTESAKPVHEGQSSPGKSGQRAVASAVTSGASSTSSANSISTDIQLSAQLKNIEKNLAKGEVFDTHRVAEIKQAISEGRFTVNADKVADGLLDTVRDLIRRRQG